MKTATATALSLVAVLGAGSAAALVNTSIFDSASTDAAASAAFVPPAAVVELTLPPVAVDATGNPVTGVSLTTPTTGSVSAPEPEARGTTRTGDRLATSATETVAPAPSTTAPTTTVVTTTPPTTSSPTSTTTVATPVTTTTVVNAPSLLTTYNLGPAGSVTVDVVNGTAVLLEATPAAGWTLVSGSQVVDGVQVVLANPSLEVSFTARYVAGALVPDITSRSLIAPTPTAPVSSYHDDDDDHDEYEDDEYEDHDDDDEDHEDDDEDHDDD